MYRHRINFVTRTLPHRNRCPASLIGGNVARILKATENLAGRAQQSLCFFRRRSPIRFFTTTTSVCVSRILSDGTRQRTRGVQAGCSPMGRLFERFRATAGPGKGNDKGLMWRGWSALCPAELGYDAAGPRFALLGTHAQWPPGTSNAFNRQAQRPARPRARASAPRFAA